MKKNTDTPRFAHLFGPVPSRRFGRSLGVDMVPFKTCTLDCVFCEVGRTTLKTVGRREYAPTAEILSELKEWLALGGTADFITVAGSGEPTLHTGFGEVLRFIRRAGRRSALLTNSTLLSDAEVRADALEADVLKATLSAWDQPSFARLHRPHPGLAFDRLLQGLQQAAAERKHELWLEVFIVPGINGSVEQVKRIAELASALRPDKIHLNTAVRPSAEPETPAADARALGELAGLFEPRAEAAGEYTEKGSPTMPEADTRAIVAMLRRRPCCARDISALFNISREQADALLLDLEAKGILRGETREGGRFFTAVAGH